MFNRKTLAIILSLVLPFSAASAAGRGIPVTAVTAVAEGEEYSGDASYS